MKAGLLLKLLETSMEPFVTVISFLWVSIALIAFFKKWD